MKSGHLAPVKMTDVEYAHYLSMVQSPLGQRLDVGESATLAIACSRNLGVVMDDNKGRRYVAERFPEVPVVSSLTLFISLTVRLGRDRTFLHSVVESARRAARMAVPKSERELLLEVLRT